MSKVVTLQLDDDVHRELREAAKAERRSLSDLIVWVALAKIREQKHADDSETAEILSDERLLKRLRAGSRARAKRPLR